MECVACKLKCRVALISMPRRYGAGARSANRRELRKAAGVVSRGAVERSLRSHEQEVRDVDRCAVAEGDGLVMGIEAGVDLPLVVAERGEGRALRRAAEAAEDQGVALGGAQSVEVDDGRAIGVVGKEDKGVVAGRSR